MIESTTTEERANSGEGSKHAERATEPESAIREESVKERDASNN